MFLIENLKQGPGYMSYASLTEAIQLSRMILHICSARDLSVKCIKPSNNFDKFVFVPNIFIIHKNNWESQFQSIMLTDFPVRIRDKN